MKRKGLNTAIAVVVTIVVLLIIAIAIVTMTTGTIGDLGGKAKEVTNDFNSRELTCSGLVSESICNANELCKWDSSRNKCIPRE